MMDPIQQTLLNGAQSLAVASSRARAWVTRLAPTASKVAAEERALVEATRKTENLARKLAASSGRRNSAGVFGPSQAGKSYLVSVLGKSKDKPLLVDFAGTTKNFIQEINPEGGKESTGLVTRFTIVRGTRDAQHPVELRLLTETDIVKIIGNSFLSDFDQHNRTLKLPAEEQVRAVIAQLEAQARQAPAHLDEIAMYDIGEYFETNFRTSVESLRRAGYWDALTRFGHRLPVPARIELYSLLWGRSPELSEVFKLLHGTLETLGHAATARAAIDCLVPRARSIIDVEIVKQHLGTPQDLQDLIGVVPELPEGGGDGPVVKVPRATLTALVAEIKVVMADKPWNFFEHTDLLDFPGARSREKMLDLPSDAQEKAFCVRNMLLRGKIAYLFQRYTEDRELTCMLLCMPPSNQEVKDLTSLVGKWVEQTHGPTAQARSQLPCALFFVLTKFDMELVAKPGDTPESWRSRIDTRLEASMYQLYKQEDWLQNWDGKAFANTFFLRNPGFELDGVFQYAAADGEGPRRETGIAVQSAERIDVNRSGMLESERCAKHFTHPALAWDSAMALNDGGVRFLVDNLERVLSPKLKTRQLAGRLVDRAQMLDRDLRRFYAAGSDASRKEKEDELMNLRRRLYAVCNEKEFPFRKFAQMLVRMKLIEGDVRGAYLDVASLRFEDAPAAAAATPGAAAAPDPDPWGDPWADAAGTSTTAATAAPPKHRERDRFDQFASKVLNLWTERVRSLASDERALTGLRMDAKLVIAVADELVSGAHRHALVERIAERTRKQLDSATTRHEMVADRAAGIASTIINDYVSYLGFGELPEAERPAVPEAPKPRQRGVFAAPPVPVRDHIPALGDSRAPLETNYFLDWGVAFKQLGLDNLGFAGGREIGEEDNRLLGDILGEIAPALQVSVA